METYRKLSSRKDLHRTSQSDLLLFLMTLGVQLDPERTENENTLLP